MTRLADPLPPREEGEGEGASADLIDYAQVRHLVGFVLRGVRRHRWLALGVFATVAAVGLVTAARYPRTYHVETRLLANRTQLLRALGNPRSGLPSEDPTRAAQETVFARGNLLSLVAQTNLTQRWHATRHPLLKLKDELLALVRGPLTDEELVEAMVGTLEKKLKVETDGVTVTISIDWPDPQLAFQLVEGAQQNFLESRHVTEIAAISEALSILELHAGAVRQSEDEALRELERVRNARQRGLAATQAPAPEAAVELPPPRLETPAQLATDQELAQIRFLLQSKRRAIGDLEDFRARRLSELTARLAEQQVEYSNEHPVVVDTQQRIAAVKQDSPQLLALRADVHELVAEYGRKGGGDPDSTLDSAQRRSGPRPRAAAVAARPAMAGPLSDDPAVEHARDTLRSVSANYEEMMMRIGAAQIELDTARAAFKYRYTVVRPAAVPSRPSRPNVTALVVAALAGALGMALLSGAVVDLWRGRLVEAWQVEQQLGLKVLAEVKRR